ncbi:MAG: cold-shock protein [Candidatus Woesearchaeota archaeon]
MEGTVKWFSEEKGYGFIVGDDGQDYFVHHSQVPEGTNLNEGDKVTFEAVDTDKGIQAQKIQLA